MIVDCFPFFNELDLLELRLRELYDHVDRFVLVEATKTQSLLDKPLYYKENKARFKTWADKIVHVIVDDCPSNEGNLWTMENFQRNCIQRGLERILLTDSDFVMISDADEIPDMNVVKEWIKKGEAIFSVNMGFYAYFFNLKAKHRDWIGTVVCRKDMLPSPQALRAWKDHLPSCSGGWHFSWLGGAKAVHRKCLSCIEPLDKSNLPSEEEFEAHFRSFLRSERKFFLHLENLSKQETEFVVDRKNLPHHVAIFQQYFL